VKLRYKSVNREPQSETSKLMAHVVTTAIEPVPSHNFKLASSVAQLGMLLRDSPHKGDATLESIPRIDAEDFAEIVAMARTAEAPKSAG
jgi:Ca-activated chloride channel family protein